MSGKVMFAVLHSNKCIIYKFSIENFTISYKLCGLSSHSFIKVKSRKAMLRKLIQLLIGMLNKYRYRSSGSCASSSYDFKPCWWMKSALPPNE